MTPPARSPVDDAVGYVVVEWNQAGGTPRVVEETFSRDYEDADYCRRSYEQETQDRGRLETFETCRIVRDEALPPVGGGAKGGT